jgi:hypothetical protein
MGRCCIGIWCGDYRFYRFKLCGEKSNKFSSIRLHLAPVVWLMEKLNIQWVYVCIRVLQIDSTPELCVWTHKPRFQSTKEKEENCILKHIIKISLNKLNCEAQKEKRRFCISFQPSQGGKKKTTDLIIWSELFFFLLFVSKMVFLFLCCCCFLSLILPTTSKFV